MMTFGPMRLWERIKCALLPTYRKQVDTERRAAIRWLVEHPEAPCVIGGVYVPNGYGERTTP